jgi:hypothetical protein
MHEASFEPPSFTEHFKQPPPELLYHYTGQEGLIGIVTKGQLWATKVQYMNDATEFGLALDKARQALRRVIENPDRRPEEKSIAAELERSLLGLEDINIFAICFCAKGDLLSQWRGYASGHGYALGFDTDALMQIADRAQFSLGRCIYDRAVQLSIVDEAIERCLQQALPFPSEQRWGSHGPLADLLFRYGVFFKDASFREEDEWRLVSPTIYYHDENLNFRKGRSMITPYYALSDHSRWATSNQPSNRWALSTHGIGKVRRDNFVDALWQHGAVKWTAGRGRVRSAVS